MSVAGIKACLHDQRTREATTPTSPDAILHAGFGMDVINENAGMTAEEN